ncbi:MAG: glycosyltransferase family 2 protein, partial [bacterium]
MPETVNENSGYVLSVIVPAFNEREQIVATLNRILGVPIDLELLVVDDASTDGTWEILQAFAAENPRIRLFRHPYNMGNGASVKTGIRNSVSPVVLIVDADGQHPPEDIPRFFEMIPEYDLVAGLRSS